MHGQQREIGMEINRHLQNYFLFQSPGTNTVSKNHSALADFYFYLFLMLSVASVKMWVVKCKLTLVRIHHKTLKKRLTVAGSCEWDYM